jgi:hypothetical protein
MPTYRSQCTAILLLGSALSWIGCRETPKSPGSIECFTEHHLYIRAARDAAAHCVVVDANGSPDYPNVRPKDRVTWHNEFDREIELTFGPAKRLFGVIRAVVPVGGATTLLVQLDANYQADAGLHAYGASSGGTETLPGPGVVVCPPSPASCP